MKLRPILGYAAADATLLVAMLTPVSADGNLLQRRCRPPSPRGRGLHRRPQGARHSHGCILHRRSPPCLSALPAKRKALRPARLDSRQRLAAARLRHGGCRRRRPTRHPRQLRRAPRPQGSTAVNVESINPRYRPCSNAGKEKYSRLIVRVDNAILVRVPLRNP